MSRERNAELGRHLLGPVAPRLPVGARDEHELRADEVERRDARPAASSQAWGPRMPAEAVGSCGLS